VYEHHNSLGKTAWNKRSSCQKKDTRIKKERAADKKGKKEYRKAIQEGCGEPKKRVNAVQKET